MSHSTGIEASEDLLNVLAQLNDEETRLLKIGICDEQLVLETSREVSGRWDQDYNEYLVPLLERDNPCYILYRMDTKNNAGFEWLFLTWSPDRSPVRQKMLYAGTRATLKTLFGGGKIVDELYGNTKDEVTLQGYYRHKESKEAPPPLSLAEEELEFVKRNEIDTATSVDSRSKTLPGVSFPVTEEAIDKLEQLRDGHLNYIRLMINIEAETIDVEDSDVIGVNALGGKVPSDHARYHVYSYSHTHEGDRMITIVFIYTMPGYNCPVKERMLYSTCKAPVTQFIENELGCVIEKKIEVASGADLTEEYLYDEVHPKKNIAKQAFPKPQGPAGRGPRRVIKAPVDQET